MTTQRIIFGYNENDTVNREEAAIVRMIFYMYVVCELSHERIAFHLNRLNVACPGDAWTDLLVYELLIQRFPKMALPQAGSLMTMRKL
jgi:hypothetical protein